MTYLYDYLDNINVFGDYMGYDRNNNFTKLWGARKHWYFWGSCLIFILSAIKIGLICNIIYERNKYKSK